MALPTVTLTGHYTEPDGTPIRGWISFCPPDVLTFSTEPQFVACCSRVKLDEFGAFSVDLVATDAPGGQPEDWAYRVVEELECRTPSSRTYFIELPGASSPVDLATLAPIAKPPTLNYVRVPGFFIDTWQGAWDTGTTYSEGDLVQYQGSTYVATDAPDNAEPPDAPWALVSAGASADTSGGIAQISGTAVNDSTPTQLPFTSADLQEAVLAAPNLRVDTAGLWTFTGTITLTSQEAAPESYTLDVELFWEDDGSERTTTAFTVTDDAGGGESFRLRFSADILLASATEVGVRAESTNIDGDPAELSGVVALALTMRKAANAL